MDLETHIAGLGPVGQQFNLMCEASKKYRYTNWYRTEPLPSIEEASVDNWYLTEPLPSILRILY